MCLPYHQQLDQREASASTPTVRTTPGRSTVCESLDLLFRWGDTGTTGFRRPLHPPEKLQGRPGIDYMAANRNLTLPNHVP